MTFEYSPFYHFLSAILLKNAEAAIFIINNHKIIAAHSFISQIVSCETIWLSIIVLLMLSL